MTHDDDDDDDDVSDEHRPVSMRLFCVISAPFTNVWTYLLSSGVTVCVCVVAKIVELLV